jgi:hypothetical protein
MQWGHALRKAVLELPEIHFDPPEESRSLA